MVFDLGLKGVFETKGLWVALVVDCVRGTCCQFWGLGLGSCGLLGLGSAMASCDCSLELDVR